METKFRKYVDWEFYSSVFDGTRNKKSGILVVNLPSVNCHNYRSAHDDEEKRLIYPDFYSWTSFHEREQMEILYPHLPERIVDNLAKPNVNISVVPWERLSPNNLKFLVVATSVARSKCEYDLSKPMRRRNG